jgi:pilus assembly protein CpaB
MLAAVLAYQYLNQADERAADKVEQVEVYVVAREIPKGTTGDAAIAEGLIELREVTKKDVPPSAIASDDEVAGKVAATQLAEGEIVVQSNFLVPSAVSGFSGTLGKDKFAVTIQVDPSKGVAGLIVPNDTVNLIVSIPNMDQVKNPADTVGGGEPLTAYLISGAKVLAVGTTTVNSTPAEGETAAPTNVGLITLEVTARQAEQIAHVPAISGSIYLSLNAPGFDPEKFEIPAEIIETWNVFDQPLNELKVKQDAVGNGVSGQAGANGQ